MINEDDARRLQLEQMQLGIEKTKAEIENITSGDTLLEEKRTVLVVREVYETHKDSTFALFTEIIHDLGLMDESGLRKIA